MSAPGDGVLDDPAELEARDAGQLLRAVASGAAQVREAAMLTAEAGVGRFAEDDLPRAVVVCGLGSAGLAGDALAAIAGPSCPVPVMTWRGPGLPTWVGAADLVMAVSGPGTTAQTLSALEEAVRRGCRLMAVGSAGSALEQLALRGRALFVPVSQARPLRASLWALVTPLVVAGDALRLLTADHETVELTAVLLERLAGRCRPDADAVLNPAKSLALAVENRLPVVWGSSALSGVAAHRFACQLAENAKTPALHGTLPEVAHHQAAVLDGPFAGGEQDLFADPADSSDTRLQLVLLRDSEEHPQVAQLTGTARDLARSRGVQVTELQAEGGSAFERLGSLVAVGDWASTYLALAAGLDPAAGDAVELLTASRSR